MASMVTKPEEDWNDLDRIMVLIERMTERVVEYEKRIDTSIEKVERQTEITQAILDGLEGSQP